ncbi:outer membrane protein [Pinisolibacter sp.]|uniref:outer membrane protein n=1 Tax=Pinisolibacter sp. TaxID=2172024 RepID=UPI002FDE529D
MFRVTLALAAAAGLTAIAPAAAADMYGAPPAAPAYGYATPAPATNWNGAYVGAHAGHAWGPATLNGTQVGVYGGLNTTVGQNVIAGVEGDLNVSGQTASRMVGGNLYKYSSDWNASIRPRIGIGFDKVMPYATAGIAFADDSLKALGTSTSTVKIGYAAGAGVEAQATDHISVKGEFIHMGFGRSTHALPGGLAARSSVNSNILRAGAAYRF